MIEHSTLPILVAAAAMLSMACATICQAEISTPASRSLYGRMGGEPIVKAVANDVIDGAAHDPKLKRSFAKVDLARVKRLLAEQICELSGGSCHYTGDPMHDVHAGLGITEAEFYGLVGVLKESLRSHGVGLRERNELLRILAPMKRDIVEK